MIWWPHIGLMVIISGIYGVFISAMVTPVPINTEVYLLIAAYHCGGIIMSALFAEFLVWSWRLFTHDR